MKRCSRCGAEHCSERLTKACLRQYHLNDAAKALSVAYGVSRAALMDLANVLREVARRTDDNGLLAQRALELGWRPVHVESGYDRERDRFGEPLTPDQADARGTRGGHKAPPLAPRKEPAQ